MWAYTEPLVVVAILGLALLAAGGWSALMIAVSRGWWPTDWPHPPDA